MDREEIKKLKRGELAGNIALAVALAGLIFFVIAYSVARTQNLTALKIAALVISPVTMVAGTATAAYCNLRFGAKLDRIIRKYILETCVQNAALMHPEKHSLTFSVSVSDTRAQLVANNGKDGIVFDFSAFGRLTLSEKATVLREIENRLIVTFCRLYERGSDYKDISYFEADGGKRAKIVPIICNGVPDKKAFKVYIKNR